MRWLLRTESLEVLVGHKTSPWFNKPLTVIVRHPQNGMMITASLGVVIDRELFRDRQLPC